MSRERLFLDTSYVLARLDRRDRYHPKEMALVSRVRDASEVWITEAVLVEVGNALSVANRADAVRFIEGCYRTANMRVVQVVTSLFLEALDFYRSRPDKAWGLTDCISFVVMRENGLTAALTADRHFVQAGFRALLLEEA